MELSCTKTNFELSAKVGNKKPDCLLQLGQDEKILENKKLENHKF